MIFLSGSVGVNYPVDSAIHHLNNYCGMEFSEMTC